MHCMQNETRQKSSMLGSGVVSGHRMLWSVGEPQCLGSALMWNIDCIVEIKDT